MAKMKTIHRKVINDNQAIVLEYLHANPGASLKAYDGRTVRSLRDARMTEAVEGIERVSFLGYIALTFYAIQSMKYFSSQEVKGMIAGVDVRRHRENINLWSIEADRWQKMAYEMISDCQS